MKMNLKTCQEKMLPLLLSHFDISMARSYSAHLFRQRSKNAHCSRNFASFKGREQMLSSMVVAFCFVSKQLNLFDFVMSQCISLCLKIQYNTDDSKSGAKWEFNNDNCEWSWLRFFYRILSHTYRNAIVDVAVFLGICLLKMLWLKSRLASI